MSVLKIDNKENQKKKHTSDSRHDTSQVPATVTAIAVLMRWVALGLVEVRVTMVLMMVCGGGGGDSRWDGDCRS